MLSIHSYVPLVGKCTVLIKYDDKSEYPVEIERPLFEEHWNEACAVLKSVTDITGDFSPLTKEQISSLETDHQARIKDETESIAGWAIEKRELALEKAIEFFKAGMYELFLEQFGNNHTSLPDLMVKRIQIAKRKLNV